MLKRCDWDAFTAIVETLLARSAARVRVDPSADHDGIDLWLYPDEDSDTPHALASCQPGTGRPVDAGPVRALYDSMTARGIRGGYLATKGFFAPDAISFARHHGIELLDIHRLVQLAGRLPADCQQALRQIAAGQAPADSSPRPPAHRLRAAA
jgi:hypothetical protein